MAVKWTAQVFTLQMAGARFTAGCGSAFCNSWQNPAAANKKTRQLSLVDSLLTGFPDACGFIALGC